MTLLQSKGQNTWNKYTHSRFNILSKFKKYAFQNKNKNKDKDKATTTTTTKVGKITDPVSRKTILAVKNIKALQILEMRLSQNSSWHDQNKKPFWFLTFFQKMSSKYRTPCNLTKKITEKYCHIVSSCWNWHSADWRKRQRNSMFTNTQNYKKSKLHYKGSVRLFEFLKILARSGRLDRDGRNSRLEQLLVVRLLVFLRFQSVTRIIFTKVVIFFLNWSFWYFSSKEMQMINLRNSKNLTHIIIYKLICQLKSWISEST